TIQVTLSSPTNATVGSIATHTYTILDDDPPPSLSINNVSLTEGTGGTTNANFSVTLSMASARTISVNFATADGTAVAGTDYMAKSGTLTFPPGTVSLTIIVAVTGDNSPEFNETFFVNLSNPINATIADGQGLGTIRSDDFIALFQGQSFGDPTWFGGPLLGWKEREYIPLRLVVSGGPVTNQFFSVDFDHTKLSGSAYLQGIQNLVNWTTSSNLVITSGPTLNAPVGVDIWTYSFTYDLTESNDGVILLWAKLAPGAHLFTGSALQLKACCGYG